MASSGEGIPLDDINQGGKSQGEEGKRTNKNKHNNKQKGPTASNPRTDKPDETKSEASPAQSEGKSVHPETSNTETETRDAPNKAASSPSPTPAEDVEEFLEDQQKKPCGETPVTPIGNIGDDPALQQEKHGSNPSSGDTMNESENTKNVEVMALEMKRLQDEIKRLKEDFRLKEEENKRLQTDINEKEADIASYLKVIDDNNTKIKDSEENIQRLIKQIDTLGAENAENVVNITEMKNFQLEILNREADLLKTKAAWEKKAKDLESRVTKQLTNMEDLRGKLQSSKNKSEGLKEKLKESEKECSRIKKEKDETVKSMDKRISSLDTECNRLNQIIAQRTQELNQYQYWYNQSATQVSWLDAEVQKLKSENQELQTYKNIHPELKQQITSLRKTVQDLENQKEDLMLRLSKIAGANLTYNNPNIADLSDEKRPTKLAEEFSELYDNEWTDAFEEVEAVDDKSRTKFLYDVLKRASEYCTDLSTGHDEAIKSSFTTLKYKVTVPITEDSEPDKDTPKDATETTTTDKVDKQDNDIDTPNGATDSTKADKVDKQEHDEGASKDATEAVPMDNEDEQENDKTNNDKDVAGTKGVDATSTKKEDEPKTELGDNSNNEDGTDENAGAHVGNNNNSPEQNTETEKDQDTSKDSNYDDSKTQDEQCMNPQNTTDEEPDGITGIGEGTNTSSVDQTTEDGQKAMPNEEPKEISKKDEALNSPEQTTSQGGDEDVDLEETSNGDQAKESGAMAEDKKGDDAEDASLLKGGKTTPINNHDDTVEGEKDDASVDGLDGSSTLDGNNATIDTKLKGEGENTDPTRNKNTETVNETNGDALGTSVDEIKDNSRPHGKEKTETKVDGNNSETNPQGEEKGTDVDQKANGNTNATNLQSGDTNQSLADTQSGNKQPTTKTIEISKIDFNFDDLSKEQLKMIMDLKKECEVQQSKDVKSNGANIIAEAMNVSKESKEMWKYILKCIDICWSMHRHEPPVHINFTSHVDGQRFDKNVYRPYTKSGKHIDYVVWPSLHLHKDGPMLGKGVAQGK